MNILLDLFFTFCKIGAFTFGGGYAMLALLDHECVEKKGWITSAELTDVTVIAESTPGPIAINCATYTGYRKAGMPGAAAATLGMILPSFLLLFCVSRFLEELLTFPAVARAFRGIRLAVALLIVQAGWKMVQKMLKKSPQRRLQALFAAFSFAAVLTADLLGVHLSTILLMAVSAVAGYCVFALPHGRKGEKV